MCYEISSQLVHCNYSKDLNFVLQTGDHLALDKVEPINHFALLFFAMQNNK